VIAGIARASQVLLPWPACIALEIGDLQGLWLPETKPLWGDR
jgi:hypothetical protein